MTSQSAKRISVEGIAVTPGSNGATRGGAARRHEFEVRAVAEFDLSAARGGTGARPELTVPDNSVIELEFEDGFRVFTVPEAIPRDFSSLSGHSIDKRGNQGAGGSQQPGTGVTGVAGESGTSPPFDAPDLAIPRQLVPRRGKVAQRSTFGWILRRLKVFDTAAARTAESLCTYYEDAIARKQGVDQLNTLCRLTLEGEARLEPIAGALPAQDGPLLVFLHGTASSTRGSFGRLWSEGEVGARAMIQRRYGQRVFGFEHRTLTESPIRNALDLVRQLPERAVLHLVSHSRGGLVGELLCRGERVQDGVGTIKPFSSVEIEQYLKRLAERTTKEGDASDRFHLHRQDLEALSEELHQRKLKVERFVRIACPVRGTTLASARFDLFLSALGNILEHLPGFAGDAAGLFADLARALIAQRANPQVLAGLEAMMPDSALIWLINHREVRVRSDLAVIAGDIEGAGVLGRLAVFLSDVFFGGQHDLVVDTDFMVGGARRVSDTWRFFTQGVDVSHFGYFGEGKARTALVHALDRTGSAPEGFAVFDLDESSGDAEGGGTRGIPGLVPGAGKVRDRKRLTIADLVPGRDVVFVLPGTMGSELSTTKDRIWLDYLGLIRGGFRQLGDRDADVVANRVIDDYYARLAIHLGESMQVIEWPYDWRRAVADSGIRLASDVDAALEQIGPTAAVRFVAHSMGGLVVRALALDHKATWDRVCEREGSRFLMLGTPNRGSWSAVQLLIGRDDTTSQLAFVDTRNSHRDLLQIISGFAGVLDLLPHDDASLYDPRTWAAWAQRDSDNLLGRVVWAPPDAQALIRAAEYAKRLDAQLETWASLGAPGKLRIGYIAGQAALTPLAISSDGPLEVLGSSGGDGRVRWDSAIVTGKADWLDTYYLPDTVHGDLAAHQAAFNGITEWLQRGATSALSTTRPQVRGDDGRLTLLPRYGSAGAEAALMTLAVGSSGRRKRDEDGLSWQVREVKVVHAHLSHATYDLLLGHYRGVDVLMNAEQELDDVMQGALKEALDLRQFPGDLNRSRLFVRPGSLRFGSGAPGAADSGAGADDRPMLGHAIVTGLGTPGELTPSTLRETVLNALLSYALRQLELDSVISGRKAARPMRMGLSSTLIGTSTSMISVEDAVVSIVRAAADASRRLHEAGHPLTFEWVEFVELWQDQAIEVVRSLKRAQLAYRLDRSIRVPLELEEGEGGLVREGAFDETQWWSRLRIAATTSANPAGSGYGELKFTLHTDRARLESRLLGTQRRQIDRFVADAIGNRAPPEGIAETLYQLLLPNELKGEALMGRRLVLLVDEQSAGYPWEMLKGNGKAEHAAPALSGGIVRQLDLENFRERGDLVTDGTAFVVGDPLLDAEGRGDGPQQLPEAEREARLVHKLLTDARYRVTPMIQSRGTDIVRVLMSQRFQILHLAGHGQYQSNAGDGSTVTGMLLGDGWYLTANEIRQMQGIPELVFANCCHLGRTDSMVVGSSLAEPHRFAASLATELMKNGVRCVIAAGWAIDDDAARTFAETFYQAFCRDGEAFGEAVRKARECCHALRPQSNTWAAFQCYGDPQFRLSRPNEEADGKSARRTQRDYVSPVEVISHLTNIPVGSHKDHLERARNRIEEIESRIRPAWRRRGDLLATLGDAYRRARNLDSAIGCYENALAASGRDPGLSALERVHDLKGLALVERYLDWLGRPEADLSRDELKRQDADRTVKDKMTAIVNDLDWIARSATSPTRLVTHAWACKRAIIMSRDESRRALLFATIEDACTRALALLRTEDLGPRSDSRLRRIERAAVVMQATATMALEAPGLRATPAASLRALRDQVAEGTSDWDDLHRHCLTWAIDLKDWKSSEGDAIRDALKSVEPILQRFKDSPRLWSIAREQWWFCQLIHVGTPSEPDGPDGPDGEGKGMANPDVQAATTGSSASSPEHEEQGTFGTGAFPANGSKRRAAKSLKAGRKTNGAGGRKRADENRNTPAGAGRRDADRSTAAPTKRR